VRLAVTGATGYLGSHLTNRALEAGHEVTAIVRRNGTLPEAIKCVTLTDIRQLTPIDLAGVESIVHFAAGTSGAKQDMLAVSVEGSLHVLRQAAAAGVRQFVHISSVSVYPGRITNELLINEAQAMDPHPERRGAYAEGKIAAELAVQHEFASLERPAMEVCIVRPGLVYGPDMKGAILGGTAIIVPFDLAIGIGRPHHRVPVIDIEDLTRGLLALLQCETTPGRLSIWTLLAPNLPTKRAWLAEYRTITGRARREIWPPTIVAIAAATLAEALSRVRGSRRELPYKVIRAYHFDPLHLDSSRFWKHVAVDPATSPGSSLEGALTSRRPQSNAEYHPEHTARLILGVATLKAAPRGMTARPLLLVGAGRVASELHVPVLHKLPGYALKAVVDSNIQLAQRIAAGFPGAVAFSSIEDIPEGMLRGGTAVIATPGATHHDLACRLLDYGLHVILEKPAALTRPEFDSLKARQVATGLEVTVIHNYRLRSNSLRLWRFLAEHRPGSLVKATLMFHSGRIVNEPASWQHHERRNRVLIMDFAIHFLDLLCVAAGPLKSFGSSSVVKSSDLSTTLSLMAVAEFQSGADAFLDLDLSGTSQRTSLTFDFERSSCTLDFFPEGFRVLPTRRSPLDDLAADLSRTATYLRQRVAATGRLPSQARPHYLIYLDHLSRASGQRYASAFTLAGVEPTMLSLYDLCEHVYSNSER
jgi:nucleoside-diphosphate-sugar epimerase/predicted dehydrogenase